jgi:hypothetical protein
MSEVCMADNSVSNSVTTSLVEVTPGPDVPKSAWVPPAFDEYDIDTLTLSGLIGGNTDGAGIEATSYGS